MTANVTIFGIGLIFTQNETCLRWDDMLRSCKNVILCTHTTQYDANDVYTQYYKFYIKTNRL